MKIGLNLTIASSLFMATAWADGLVPDDFARALTLETDSSTAIYEVKLPLNVYETLVRSDLGDMRVFNANEERVPHTLRKPEQFEIRETRISLPIFPLHASSNKNSSGKLDFTVSDDGAILSLREQDNAVVMENAQIQKYIIDISSIGKRVSALEFELTGADDNYVKRLSIEQSKDLNNWRRLLNTATLTQLQYGDHELQLNRINLPQHNERYLRFSWHDASDGAQLSHVHAILKSSENRSRPLWQSRNGDMIDAEEQIYQFDTGGAFPVEQFNIELLEGNTLIEAQVASRSDKKSEWRRRYQGLFYSLQVQGNQIQNDLVAIPMVDDRYWQLKVNTKDGMGKVPPRFRFGWSGHTLFFLARGPGPFTLAFGSGKAGPAERPVAALLNVLNSKSHTNFTAKAYISDSYELSGDAAMDKHFDISWQRIVLWLVLAGGVLLLGVMAFRLLQQMNKEQ